MQEIAAIAWLWSGVATITASRLFSLSSIRRKSLYLAAFGYLSKVLAARFQSGSAKAMMFSLEHPAMSLAPLPPTPIAAIFSFSFGDL